MRCTRDDLNAFALLVRAKLGWDRTLPDHDEEMAQPRADAARDNHLGLVWYWPKILAALCSASAIEMALMSAQIHSQKQLPLIYCFLGLAMIMSFTCIFVGKSIHFNYPLAAHVLQQFGVFFGVTAIFISITIPYSNVWFKCIVWFIYVLCWLTILLCCLMRK